MWGDSVSFSCRGLRAPPPFSKKWARRTKFVGQEKTNKHKHLGRDRVRDKQEPSWDKRDPSLGQIGTRPWDKPAIFLFNSTVKSPFCPVCPWDGTRAVRKMSMCFLFIGFIRPQIWAPTPKFVLYLGGAALPKQRDGVLAGDNKTKGRWQQVNASAKLQTTCSSFVQGSYCWKCSLLQLQWWYGMSDPKFLK